MRNTISKAIQAIGNSQRQDGGWRYAFTKEGASDISATTVVLWALRSAKKSGLTINSEVIKKGVKFIESCAQPDGTFRYRAFGLYATPSLGGAAIVALSNAGNLNHVLIPPARDRIAYDYRRYDVEDLKMRRYFVYGAFHASLAMYTFGDELWVPFYKKTAAVLRTLQDKDGSWSDDHGNTTYTTAMALMIFQAPYGYLPLYER
jgi:squalene cyclase